MINALGLSLSECGISIRFLSVWTCPASVTLQSLRLIESGEN